MTDPNPKETGRIPTLDEFLREFSNAYRQNGSNAMLTGSEVRTLMVRWDDVRSEIRGCAHNRKLYEHGNTYCFDCYVWLHAGPPKDDESKPLALVGNFKSVAEPLPSTHANHCNKTLFPLGKCTCKPVESAQGSTPTDALSAREWAEEAAREINARQLSRNHVLRSRGVAEPIMRVEEQADIITPKIDAYAQSQLSRVKPSAEQIQKAAEEIVTDIFDDRTDWAGRDEAVEHFASILTRHFKGEK